MNTVSIREFQRNMYRHLKDLPIVVTKNSNPLFYVVTNPTVPFNTIASPEMVKISKPVATGVKKKIDKDDFCPHFIYQGNNCRSCNG